jgi:hypothetical protein
MTGSGTPAVKHDVFLSHSNADKPLVEKLAIRLQEAGLAPFFDKWHLVPGEPWQEALEKALDESATCECAPLWRSASTTGDSGSCRSFCRARTLKIRPSCLGFFAGSVGWISAQESMMPTLSAGWLRAFGESLQGGGGEALFLRQRRLSS